MHRFVGYSDLHIGRIHDMACSVTSHLCRVYALHRDCLSLSCISFSVRFYNVRGKNYYHTLRNSVSRKSFSYKAPSLSILSSLFAGIGIVTLFNAVGVYL